MRYFWSHYHLYLNFLLFAFKSSITLLFALQFMFFPLWPLILLTYDFYVPFFLTNYNFVLVSCKILGFLNFHVS